MRQCKIGRLVPGQTSCQCGRLLSRSASALSRPSLVPNPDFWLFPFYSPCRSKGRAFGTSLVVMRLFKVSSVSSSQDGCHFDATSNVRGDHLKYPSFHIDATSFACVQVIFVSHRCDRCCLCSGGICCTRCNCSWQDI